METLADVDLQHAVDPLIVARDGADYVLGRPDLGLYVVVPEPGAVLVTALREGASLADATVRAGRAAGTEVDGPDFLRGLAEVGLLAAPASQVSGAEPARGRRIRWIEGVTPRMAGHLFGRVAWTCYALAAAFAAAVLAVRADLRPSIDDVWFLGDPVRSVLVLVLIGIFLAAAHEAWHWLAGRAIGVPAVFRVSRRGVYLVFETDLTRIVTVPRRRRYGPFLAGMACDSVVLAAALGLRLSYRTEVLDLAPILDRLLGVVVVNQVFAIGWQWAAVFLRSDGYAVLANALRCHNLYRATWLTAKNRLWRLSPAEATELAEISPHDRAVARWFALVYVVGMTGVGLLLLAFAVPFGVTMILWAAANLGSRAIGSVAFWESVAVTAFLALQWAAPVLLALRERRLRRRGELL
jgi:hypothetical protein